MATIVCHGINIIIFTVKKKDRVFDHFQVVVTNYILEIFTR